MAGSSTPDRTRNILNIQPVIPLADGKIITRTILPVAWLPDLGAESGSQSTGLADTLFTAFYAVPAGSLTVGVGPALEVPTGGSTRGSQKWSLGPSAVALAQPGGFIRLEEALDEEAPAALVEVDPLGVLDATALDGNPDSTLDVLHLPGSELSPDEWNALCDELRRRWPGERPRART